MKTTVLFRTIALMVVVLAGVTSFELKAQDNFVTNEVKTGDLVTEKVIYKNEGALYRHLKYNYTYDGEGKMIGKEAFKWDGGREVWTPYYKVSYQYAGNEIFMEYARWNKKSKAYDLSREKNVYEWNEANMPVAYINYKWDASKGDWRINSNYLYDSFLLAQIR